MQHIRPCLLAVHRMLLQQQTRCMYRTMLHELSHIRHQNHGPGFQALLKELTEVRLMEAVTRARHQALGCDICSPASLQS